MSWTDPLIRAALQEADLVVRYQLWSSGGEVPRDTATICRCCGELFDSTRHRSDYCPDCYHRSRTDE